MRKADVPHWAGNYGLAEKSLEEIQAEFAASSFTDSNAWLLSLRGDEPVAETRAVKTEVRKKVQSQMRPE